MARRDLRAHPLRTLATTIVVAIPVLVALVVSTVVATDDWYSENSLAQRYGPADAELQVTPWDRAQVDVVDAGGAVYPNPVGTDGRPTRDPADVDVLPLLPPGSRVVRSGTVAVPLASGGTMTAVVAAIDDPLFAGRFDDLTSGRAPRAPDEVAVTELVRDEVGRDGTLELQDGTALTIVGTTARASFGRYDQSLLVVPPSSRLVERPREVGPAESPDWVSYVVDLPDLSVAEGQALQQDLARAGIGARMRDSVERPGAWGTPGALPEAVDPVAAAVGALVVGLGLLVVVVVVGAVFAVGARRQGRVLGLMMAAGATAADLRRTLLAQGVCIGTAAAALGGLGAWAVLDRGRGPLGELRSTTYTDWSVSVLGVVTTLLLGVLSAVVAAAIPAWGVGRLTAAQALDGHVATGPRAARHRLRTPGLWIVGLGVVLTAAGGLWTASAFDVRTASNPTPVPVLVAGLGVTLLVIGTGLLAPWLVAVAGRVTGRGWLPWRLAARDATRHRGRTVASVLAVGIATTTAALVGFGLEARADQPVTESQSLTPVDVADVVVTPGSDLDDMRQTMSTVVGATSLATWRYGVLDGGRTDRPTYLVDRTGTSVRIVDDAYLRAAGVDDAARARFADGAAVVAAPGLARDDEVVVRVGGPRKGERHTLDAVTVESSWAGYEPVWVSGPTARSLGVVPEPSYAGWAVVPGGLTTADQDRLRLHGIDAYSDSAVDDVDGRTVLVGALGALGITALVVGLVVALAASESRDDVATLTAVGAPPWLRRTVSAGHALFVGGLGGGLGLLVGTAGGVAVVQVIGTPGTSVPWTALGLLALGVPLLCAVVGWLVAPSRLTLTRRAG